VTELTLHRRLPHPIDRVWRAVTEPAELAAWFVGPPAPWTPALGETFTALDSEGRITVCEPPRAFAWEWDIQRFRFDLAPDGDGTRLTFTHRYDPSYGPADQHAVGWETYFTRLDAHLAGGSLDELEAHEQRQLSLGDGPELRLRRRVFHPVERVWRALTDGAELAQWFPGELEVVEAEAPRLLVARWHGETLRFELEADGDAAVLRFTHAFGDRDVAARTAAGWDRCLARLDALLAGGALSERDSLALWPQVHERYAETFGVDPEIGRRAYAEHPAT
jgi:uncharacterized protein YndB with AHSA1/START domain